MAGVPWVPFICVSSSTRRCYRSSVVRWMSQLVPQFTSHGLPRLFAMRRCLGITEVWSPLPVSRTIQTCNPTWSPLVWQTSWETRAASPCPSASVKPVCCSYAATSQVTGVPLAELCRCSCVCEDCIPRTRPRRGGGILLWEPCGSCVSVTACRHLHGSLLSMLICRSAVAC